MTDSYLGLDQNIRGCQNEEPLQSCTTKVYTDTVLEECGCLPLNMRTSQKDPLCTSQKLECVNKIEVDTARCMKPCSGLIVTSFRKDSLQINWEEKFPVLAAYDHYKIITQYPTGYNGKIECLLTVTIFDRKNCYF